MATAIGTPYSPPSPPDTSSSATMSPVYPDRPIRPLPRRSLRARLSPEIAEQILFPSAPRLSSSALNHYREAMGHRNGATIASAIQEVEKVLPSSGKEYDTERSDAYRFRGSVVDSDDEDHNGVVRRLDEYHLHQSIVPISGRVGINSGTRNPENMSRSVASSNDSIDGYDSFENTNNKKKRKIPTSGGLGSHHATLSTSLSNEMANMGISGSHEAGSSSEGSGDSVGQYYGSGTSVVQVASSGTGISGAGRGRYGRTARRDTSGRSPLGVSNGNTSNAWQVGRLTGARREYAGNGSYMKDTPTDHGIISAAIAEAAVLPNPFPKGREHVSLLDQQQSRKTAPGMVWPGESSQHHAGSYPNLPEANLNSNSRASRGFSTHATQTSPSTAGQSGQRASSHMNHQQHAEPPTKPRRSAAKRYALAERQRKLQQQYNSYHHPPRGEDIWICEFCEYESIFGVPPVALVRQYEIKDSRERKRLAEKRRLLEKAKMKGRKGKKGNKSSGKISNPANQHQQHPNLQENISQQVEPGLTSHSIQSDDYAREGYDDEPPGQLLSHQQSQSRIPRPVPQAYRQTTPALQTNGVP